MQNLAKTLLVASVLTALSSAAYSQTLGDFQVPTQSANPEAIAAAPPPGSVTAAFNEDLETDVLQGKDAESGVQDAVNHARAELLEEPGVSVRFISTPSGIGLVARGRAFYETGSANPNLVLINQRKAWVEARLDALRTIAETLSEDGLGVEGRLSLAEQQVNLDNSESSSANYKEAVAERVDALVSTFLRGVVTYTVDDDPSKGEVFVTLVTTPKTQGQVSRVSDRVINADTLQNGLTAMFSDLAARTVPPVGSAVIAEPETGAIAWVGYGSSLVRYNRNPAVERRNREFAYDAARLRSDAALAAAISGERVNAESSLETEFNEQIKQFEELMNEHGDTKVVHLQEEQFAQTSRAVVGSEITTETVAKLRGIQRASYESPDGRWVWHVSIYFPDAAEAAERVARSMRQNNPLGSPVRRGRGFETNPDGSFKQAADGSLIPRSLGSGDVTRKEDL